MAARQASGYRRLTDSPPRSHWKSKRRLTALGRHTADRRIRTARPKGLYHKARVGELRNFTGIDSACEPPEAPDLHLHTLEMTIDEEVDRIIDALQRRGVFD